MLISELAKTFLELEKTSSRNEITRILAGLLRRANSDEIAKICYLALGELAPAYRGIDFNLAEKMLLRALAVAHSVPAERILKMFKASGDLGNVAYEFAKAKSKNQKSKLAVAEVYDRLMAVTEESGTGSQERKIRILAGLIGGLDPATAKFIARMPAGKLRLGFSDATLLDALSIMAKGDKSARPAIERAYNVTADIGEIAQVISREGLNALAKIQPRPGIPIRPALAEQMPDPEEVIKKLGPVVAIEPKLDGLRTAIHIWGASGKKEIRLFSRNLENTTAMFPEITASAAKLKVASAILDGETIGYDSRTGKFAAFQETAKRKRKHNIKEAALRIPLAIFIFDILYLNGRSLLDQPWRERRKILEELLPQGNSRADASLPPKPLGAIRLTEKLMTDQPAVISAELEKAVGAGLEGLVVKNPSLPYQTGSRGFHWVKIKRLSAALNDIRAKKAGGLSDTIDCVLMGAYKGKGKRAKFDFGGFLLGVRGKDNKFYTISRLGTGLSDQTLRDMSLLVKKTSAKEKPADYIAGSEIAPDLWIKPEVVVEILADAITLSPRHTARLKNEHAYSLRFPRLVRFRQDKSPADATTVDEIAKLYRLQAR